MSSSSASTARSSAPAPTTWARKTRSSCRSTAASEPGRIARLVAKCNEAVAPRRRARFDNAPVLHLLGDNDEPYPCPDPRRRLRLHRRGRLRAEHDPGEQGDAKEVP